jgi:hypothetical protein
MENWSVGTGRTPIGLRVFQLSVPIQVIAQLSGKRFRSPTVILMAGTDSGRLASGEDASPLPRAFIRLCGAAHVTQQVTMFLPVSSGRPAPQAKHDRKSARSWETTHRNTGNRGRRAHRCWPARRARSRSALDLDISEQANHRRSLKLIDTARISRSYTEITSTLP